MFFPNSSCHLPVFICIYMLRSAKTFWSIKRNSLTAGTPFSLYPLQSFSSLPISNRFIKAEIVFDNYDEDGNRLVRSEETNSGDFAADALYYLFDSMDLDVDVAIMNGGGIRNRALTGDITYKICKDMHTFGNVACLQTVTGQQLLDALVLTILTVSPTIGGATTAWV